MAKPFDYENDKLTPLETFIWSHCEIEHDFEETRNETCHYCNSLKSNLINLAKSGAFKEYIKDN